MMLDEDGERMLLSWCWWEKDEKDGEKEPPPPPARPQKVLDVTKDSKEVETRRRGIGEREMKVLGTLPLLGERLRMGKCRL